MSLLVLDVEQLFKQVFGTKPYHVEKAKETNDDGSARYKIQGSKADDSAYITKDSKGVEIWLPTYLEDLPKEIGDNGKLFLPYCVIRITGQSTIIRTPLAERRGSAKEQYNTDDYKITIKGFFIDKEKRLFPEKDLQALKKIHEYGKAFKITNAITDIFLTDTSVPADEQHRVVITGFDLPEVEGGKKSMRPFVMQLESDCVFTLEVE